METNDLEKIKYVLVSINNVFGRGDIIRIDYENMKVYRKFQFGSDVRDFYIINNKVRFLSHERVIK